MEPAGTASDKDSLLSNEQAGEIRHDTSASAHTKSCGATKPAAEEEATATPSVASGARLEPPVRQASGSGWFPMGWRRASDANQSARTVSDNSAVGRTTSQDAELARSAGWSGSMFSMSGTFHASQFNLFSGSSKNLASAGTEDDGKVPPSGAFQRQSSSSGSWRDLLGRRPSSNETGGAPGQPGSDFSRAPSSGLENNKVVGSWIRRRAARTKEASEAKQTPREQMKQLVGQISSRLKREHAELHREHCWELFDTLRHDTAPGGKISVLDDLGEALIRLGIAVEAAQLQQIIHEVCVKRGRGPDRWEGVGVSLKTPVYDELDLEEFVALMQRLSQGAGEVDPLVHLYRVFKRLDKNSDKVIAEDELVEALREAKVDDFEEANVREIFSQLSIEYGTGLKKGLDFAFFESLMGFSGGDDAYIRAALQERRHLLLEALTTFHTFDVDGRGAIDVAKISFAMRAIGHSVDMYTVAKMVALADERHTGDIDFESFCLYVLGHSEEDLMEMLQAHRVQPLILDQQIGTQRRRLTVDRLAPAAWKKSFHLSRHIEEGAEKALEAKEKAEFVYQDYGQFGKLAFKHSLFDASMPILQLRLEKKILSRPWAITCAKDAGTVTSARFAPNGQRLAVSCHDGTLRIYDICSPKAKLIATVEANDHFCLCLEWTQDGSMIVTGGGDWMVSIWSAEDLSFLGSEMAHSGYVRAVATSFNNKYVASGSSDMSLRVWKYFPFKSDERPLLGHTSWVRWCHFSHDSKRLISGGDDQTIIVWDVMAGQALQTLRAHSHTVSAGYLFPNNRLFTGSFDENVLMWTLDTGLIGYLKVFVVEAFDLPAGDFLSGAMSNMRFVKIELGKGQQEQTDNKKGSSPGWFEEFNFSVWNLDESVCVQIFDWDKDEAHRFLGEAWVPLEELVYAEEGVTDREFELVDAEGGKGKACISLRFTFREVKCIGEVTVLVEKARNLPRMDTFGLADPFCAVNVGKSERHKTKVVKNNLNPEWNEEFVYNVEEGARELKLVLYDWSITKAEEFIGQVVFPIDELLKEPFRDQWFKLKTIDGAADAKGELKVKIKFLSEQERDKGAIRYRRNPTTWPASIREDFSYYAPVGQVKFFGRTIMRGICKHCKKHRNRHSNNLRCDLGVGNYVHCIDVSCDGQLIAWGTGDGRIRIASVLSSEQLACWTAHAGPVHGLKFAPEDERLISWGVDFREADPSEFFFGSFIPRPEAHSTHSIGRAQVVEIWYVGSMLASIQIGRQRRGLLSNAPNMGAADKDESDEEEDEDEEKEDEDEDEEGLSSPDGSASPRGDKDKQEDAKEKEKLMEAMSRRKKGARRRLPGAKVGYTPVYYEPPKLEDGTAVRSCLKGRGRTTVLRGGIVWSAQSLSQPAENPIFYYPPAEYDDEDDEDDEDGEDEEQEARTEKLRRIKERKAREREQLKAKLDAADEGGGDSD